MHILISGGCGYVGSKLIPMLLNKGHKITNIDLQWFGNYLKKNQNLKNIKDNISNIHNYNFNKIDAILHLASVANDPMAEIDKNLSWETSALNSIILAEYAKKNKIKKFIYASSGSVYGVKKEKNVTETSDLTPISLYNKVKMVTEKILSSYNSYFDLYIIRPATVCGYSPRMRLDLTVNVLTYSAVRDKIINVYGGKQIRPNIHIDDMCEVYIHFLKKKIMPGIYNAGFENMSISKIAELVSKYIKCKINYIKDKSDPRSYRLDSRKLISTSFKVQKNVKIGIMELIKQFENKKYKFKQNQNSLKWLKKILKKK